MNSKTQIKIPKRCFIYLKHLFNCIGKITTFALKIFKNIDILIKILYNIKVKTFKFKFLIKNLKNMKG